jgi:pSer/pThr/pTyr-binding forkhead associated (FHA) protein
VLSGADISRTHCRIVASGSGIAVNDLNSTNGTFLNDRRVAASTRLKTGDRLQVGSYVLEYRQESASMAPDGMEGTRQARSGGLQTGRP